MSDRTKLDLERTCIVTKAKGAPEAMIRFVLGPGAEVVPDLRHKLPGRGVWVTAEAQAVAEAVRRKAFARGFKAEVKVSATLPAEVESLLTQNCLQALSLAKKAGQLVAGFFKAETAVRAGRIIALVHASDAGPDGIRKLGQALRAASCGKMPPEIKLFTSIQLSLALGGTNMVHAALTEGAASEAFLSHCRKLERYRSTPPSDAGAREASDDGAI